MEDDNYRYISSEIIVYKAERVLSKAEREEVEAYCTADDQENTSNDD